jgi:DNA-directed RNA polymerase
MVHDSFGVHAGDVDLLNRVLREEFVGMYSELVMSNFFMEVLKSSPVGLPSLPTPGTLDIRQVLESPYFFA